MAKIEFDVENKALDSTDFPKLKLKVGEKARISILETAPEFAFVHTLRKPVIGDDGKFVKEERSGKRGKYEVISNEFVGQHICFGDLEVLVKNGDDAANCPTCQIARTQEGIGKPERRFAMHVLQYECQQNSFVPQQPLVLRLRVWTFGDKRYNEMADMAESWKEHGGLRFRDLELGPCEPPELFQKFSMNASPESIWTKTEENKNRAKEIYKNNKVPDLEVCIARRVTKEQAKQDIAKVVEAYEIGNGTKAAPAPKQSAEEVNANVANILDGIDSPATSEAVTATNADIAGLDSVFDSIKEEAATPAAEEVKAEDPATTTEAAAPAEPTKVEEPMDFDAMLAELGN